MLLDGERPRVRPNPKVIVLDEEKLVKIWPERDRMLPEQELRYHCRQQHDPKSWIDLQSAANEEALDVDRAMRFVFGVQQTGDQETAQHEKQIHANPAGLRGDVI